MAVPLQDYLAMLRCSRLVDEDDLGETLREIAFETLAPTLSADVARRLEEKQLVNAWQNQRLFAGEHQLLLSGMYRLVGDAERCGFLADRLRYTYVNGGEYREERTPVVIRWLATRWAQLSPLANQCRAIASLRHPNLLRTFELNQHDKLYYLVLERFDGTDLEEVVAQQGPLRYEQAVEYIRQAAKGLASAHQGGVIHRHLGPRSLLLGADGTIKVDIAWMVPSRPSEVEEGLQANPDYLAPEQSRQGQRGDARADIYALGGTLYFLLTGHSPLVTPTPAQRLARSQTPEPRPITDVRPDAPADLVEICRVMRAPEPDSRYQTAADLGEALRDWLKLHGHRFAKPRPAIPLGAYLTTLRRSQLVEESRLNDTLLALKREQGQAPQGADLAQRLEEERLVTAWQNQQLAAGEHQGLRFGKYQVLGKHRWGGYLVEHREIGSRAILRQLSERPSPSRHERLLYELAMVIVFDHPNLERALHVDHQDGRYYVVQELLEGLDLQQVVFAEGPLPYALAADYIRQAADGLAHAHALGMMHRDIRPSNLILAPAGTIKVTHMYWSRLAEDYHQRSLTVENHEYVMGTTDYLAPEPAMDSHHLDLRGDIYSLGCTLYFLLTGHPPFPTGTLAQRLMKHQTEEPAPITNERPDAPADLLEIWHIMQAKKPADRYQTAAEVSAALRDWLKKHREGPQPPGA